MEKTVAIFNSCSYSELQGASKKIRYPQGFTPSPTKPAFFMTSGVAGENQNKTHSWLCSKLYCCFSNVMVRVEADGWERKQDLQVWDHTPLALGCPIGGAHLWPLIEWTMYWALPSPSRKFFLKGVASQCETTLVCPDVPTFRWDAQSVVCVGTCFPL